MSEQDFVAKGGAKFISSIRNRILDIIIKIERS